MGFKTNPVTFRIGDTKTLRYSGAAPAPWQLDYVKWIQFDSMLDTAFWTLGDAAASGTFTEATLTYSGDPSLAGVTMPLTLEVGVRPSQGITKTLTITLTR